MNEQNIHELTYGNKTVRMHLPRSDDLIQKNLRTSGEFYELELLDHARQLLRPGDLVLDVGANIGTHTVFLSAIAGARVHAFEPQLESVSTLKQNVELNELTERVTVHEIGLGAGPARADVLVVDERNLGRSKLQPCTDGATIVHAYDDLGLNLQVKVVKIDVEGMEREVLLGMRLLLRDCQPALYVEIQDPFELSEIQSLLDDLGYTLVECFNSTPTYCFLPAVTAAQQFQALMSRWDASIRGRARARGDSLAPSERGPLADKFEKLQRKTEQQIEPLQTQLTTLTTQLNAVTDHLQRQTGQHVAPLQTQLTTLTAQLNALTAQVERTTQELRALRQQRILPKLVTLVTRPKKSWQAIRKRLAAMRASPRTADRQPAGPDDLVSVVMTCHNSEAFVADAVHSILNQSHRKLELIAVDDASSDDTIAVLTRIQAQDARLRIIRCQENRGTYWSKNLGLMHARGRFVTTQDSDDISDPDRIRRQLQVLDKLSGPMISTCNYVRVDSRGKIMLNRGLEQRLGLITLMFDKDEVLSRIGFFDSVRTSADAEYLQRMKLAFPKACFAHVDAPLYRAKIREESLSAKGVDLSAQEGQQGFLSEDRQRYVTAFEAWHTAEPGAYMPFPLRNRPFEAPPTMTRNCAWGQDHVTVSMASIPSRRHGLERVVDSLLDQVDHLNVYLNNYDEVPAFLEHPKIRVVRSQDHGDIRDNGKFHFVEKAVPGYYFTVDDDIVYPKDYVAFLVGKLRQYGHRAVVGFHGTIFPGNMHRFFEENGRTVLSFKHALADDRQVHLLGSGTTAWHTSTLSLSLRDFETTGMADLWLGIRAQQQGVPMIAVARSQGYLQPITDLAPGSLYEEFVSDDSEQTRLFKEHAPWQLPPLGNTMCHAAPRSA